MPFHQVDVHVGVRMRQRRTLLGMSQTKLGDAVGLTFQQVQKYERGSNRMGSSRIFEFAKALDVPVAYFFEVNRLDFGADHGRHEPGRARPQMPTQPAPSPGATRTAGSHCGRAAGPPPIPTPRARRSPQRSRVFKKLKRPRNQ